jgi:hypothetical protein
MLRSRNLVGIAAALALLVCAAGAGAASGWTVQFSFVPKHAYQGQPASVSVLVRPGAAQCSLSVRYADGSHQPGLSAVHASAGHASWTWSLASSTPVGPARASVTCGRAGSLVRMFTVVGGTVEHSKLTVVKQGFTQRPDSYDGGSSISYGVVLDNPSTSEDAQSVTVLVNFVDGNDHVVQTATTQVSTVVAGSSYNLGGSASLPSQTPVTKLEVVVQTQSFAAHSLHIPAAQNLQIVASRFDPGWVGEVDGEIVNDDPAKVLSSAQLSVVLFDAAGEVVGGGVGLLYASLPPGTRSFFAASTGFSSVPWDRASVAAISVVPSYLSR